jgi:hypothetical protein
MGTGLGRIGNSSLDEGGDFGSYFGEFGYLKGEGVLSGAVVKDWGGDIRCFDFHREFRRSRNRLWSGKAVLWLFHGVAIHLDTRFTKGSDLGISSRSS